MNFPGLDSAWIFSHRLLKSAGIIQPWNLEKCKESLQRKEGVLVVATTALGDSILCTPLLETSSRELGKERVGFLVRRNYRSLYEHDPRLAKVFSVSGKYRGFAHLRNELAQQKIPFRIALIANSSEPDLIPWLWWCGIRGFLRYRSRWSYWADWMANRVMLKRPHENGYASGHAIDNNLAMAEALDLPIHSRQLSISIPEANLQNSVTKKNLILVHPGASRRQKQWSVDNWSEVITALAAKGNYRFAITGSESEQNLANDLQQKLSVSIKNLVGKLTLIELAQLQKKALLFLSGDTGPYHLAVAVGCPTVTLFAPTDRGSSIEACGPNDANSLNHRALQTENFNQSIDTISPDFAVKAASEILGLK